MSKKVLILFLLFSVTVSCYACGGSEPGSESVFSDASSSEETTAPAPISEIELSEETSGESAVTSEASDEPETSEASGSSEASSGITSEGTSEPAESSEEPSESSEEQPKDEKPHMVNGFLVYNGRAMEPFGGTATSGRQTAEVMNTFAEKVGEGVNVYAMPIPLACAFYAPEGYEKYAANTEDCFYGLRDALSGVRFADVLSALRPHVGENLYARTDHHWFARGAYYAAQELCRVAGVPFAELDSMTENSFDGFLGSAYSAYKVTELKQYPETFTWYEPTQAYTAHYFDQKLRNESITGSMFSSSNSYTKFIRGDGYAVRVDTGVTNGRKLLVIKDSFGNALAPFLIAGFEQVFLVDLREFNYNVLTLIRENGITDVALALSAFSVASAKRDNLLRLIRI